MVGCKTGIGVSMFHFVFTVSIDGLYRYGSLDGGKNMRQYNICTNEVDLSFQALYPLMKKNVKNSVFSL